MDLQGLGGVPERPVDRHARPREPDRAGVVAEGGCSLRQGQRVQRPVAREAPALPRERGALLEAGQGRRADTHEKGKETAVEPQVRLRATDLETLTCQY